MQMLRNATSLFTEAMSDLEIFLAKSLGSTFIDTACTRSVYGEKWLENYVKDLNPDQVDQSLQTEIPSCRTFQVGDRNFVYSTRKVKLIAKNRTDKISCRYSVATEENLFEKGRNHFGHAK